MAYCTWPLSRQVPEGCTKNKKKDKTDLSLDLHFSWRSLFRVNLYIYIFFILVQVLLVVATVNCAFNHSELISTDP